MHHTTCHQMSNVNTFMYLSLELLLPHKQISLFTHCTHIRKIDESNSLCSFSATQCRNRNANIWSVSVLAAMWIMVKMIMMCCVPIHWFHWFHWFHLVFLFRFGNLHLIAFGCCSVSSILVDNLSRCQSRCGTLCVSRHASIFNKLKTLPLSDSCIVDLCETFRDQRNVYWIQDNHMISYNNIFNIATEEDACLKFKVKKSEIEWRELREGERGRDTANANFFGRIG